MNQVLPLSKKKKLQRTLYAQLQLRLLTKCIFCRDEFINGSCTGTQPFDESRCSKCTPQPTPNHYTPNPCDGQTRTDQQWLSCATSCPAGQYISSPCTNTTRLGCTECKRQCPAGFFMRGSCTGNEYYDAVQCVACKESCGAGQYRSTLCAGNLTYDTVTCKSCRTQCAEGEYIFGRCGGAGSFDETSCVQCKVCPRDRPNAYNSIYRSCNGSDTEDVVVCALNQFNQTMPGDACPAGNIDCISLSLSLYSAV